MEIATHLSEAVHTGYGNSSSLGMPIYGQLMKSGTVRGLSADQVSMSQLGSRNNALQVMLSHFIR